MSRCDDANVGATLVVARMMNARRHPGDRRVGTGDHKGRPYIHAFMPSLIRAFPFRAFIA